MKGSMIYPKLTALGNWSPNLDSIVFILCALKTLVLGICLASHVIHVIYLSYTFLIPNSREESDWFISFLISENR